MQNLDELLGVKTGVKFDVEVKDGDEVNLGTYYVQGNILYDNLDRISDDVLGKIMRGKANIVRGSSYGMLKKIGEKYFFFDTKSKIRTRENRWGWQDIINALLGNMFEKESFMTSDMCLDIQRKRSRLMEEDAFEAVRAALETATAQKSKTEGRDMDYILQDSFQKSLLEEN